MLPVPRMSSDTRRVCSRAWRKTSDEATSLRKMSKRERTCLRPLGACTTYMPIALCCQSLRWPAPMRASSCVNVSTTSVGRLMVMANCGLSWTVLLLAQPPADLPRHEPPSTPSKSIPCGSRHTEM